MLIAFNVGNTNLAWGIFEGNQLLQTGRQTLRSVDLHKDLSQSGFVQYRNKIEKVVLAGVNPSVEDKLFTAIQDFFQRQPLVIGKDITVPLDNKCNPPEAVGTDRLLNAYAAHSLSPNEDLIVVDFGTAISFSVVSAMGEFLGGAIAPGVRMSARALNRQTANLPEVIPEIQDIATGTTTEEAINVGLSLGFAGLVDLILDGLQDDCSVDTSIIGTGGDLDWFTCQCRHHIKEHPNLVLYGMMFVHADQTVD